MVRTVLCKAVVALGGRFSGLNAVKDVLWGEVGPTTEKGGEMLPSSPFWLSESA